VVFCLLVELPLIQWPVEWISSSSNTHHTFKLDPTWPRSSWRSSYDDYLLYQRRSFQLSPDRDMVRPCVRATRMWCECQHLAPRMDDRFATCNLPPEQSHHLNMCAQPCLLHPWNIIRERQRRGSTFTYIITVHRLVCVGIAKFREAEQAHKRANDCRVQARQSSRPNRERTWFKRQNKLLPMWVKTKPGDNWEPEPRAEPAKSGALCGILK
jgi:hypothetical protein